MANLILLTLRCCTSSKGCRASVCLHPTSQCSRGYVAILLPPHFDDPKKSQIIWPLQFLSTLRKLFFARKAVQTEDLGLSTTLCYIIQRLKGEYLPGPARAWRATFVLTIPTLNTDSPSLREVPQVDQSGPQTFPTKHAT